MRTLISTEFDLFLSMQYFEYFMQVSHEDYPEDWNETVRGFKYPTEIPTAQ